MQDQITAGVHASRIRVVGAASIDINPPPRKKMHCSGMVTLEPPATCIDD